VIISNEIYLDFDIYSRVFFLLSLYYNIQFKSVKSFKNLAINTPSQTQNLILTEESLNNEKEKLE
jgi:hypothetical protein